MTNSVLPLTLTPNLPADLASVPIIDVRGQLPVNPLYTWETLKGLRNLDDLSTVVCHHDCWPKKITAKWDDMQLMREIAGDHIRNKKNIPGGDAGFPYHCFVRNGKVYICNDILDFTYGVANNNGYTIHVAMSGDYRTDVMEERDRKALYRAILFYKAQLTQFKELAGHGELNPSQCPVYSMSQVRTDVGVIERAMALNDQLDTTPNANMAKVFSAHTRFEDLYKLATTSGPHQSEAVRKCIQIADTMIAAGILKA